MSKFNNRTDVYDKRKLAKLDLKDLRDVNWTRLSGKACQRLDALIKNEYLKTFVRECGIITE